MKLRFVACFVLSFFALSFTAPLAAPQPAQGPVQLLAVPEGELTSKYVGKQVRAQNMTYLTYIAGYDGPYFSDPMVHNETTAYFTVRPRPGVANVRSGAFRAGDLGSHEVDLGGGIGDVYFDETPDGDYTNPDTFSDGILIGSNQQGPAQAINLFQPGTDIFHLQMLSRTLIKTFAGSFTIGGKTYTFGTVGDRDNSFVMTTPNPNDPNDPKVEFDFIGRTTKLPSAP